MNQYCSETLSAEDRRVLPVVCKLVAYLVANIVRDESEWQEWGLPFISMTVEAQLHGLEDTSLFLDELHSQFCPLIGHGLCLILEDGDKDDFTFVHSAEERLGSILQEVDISEADLDGFVQRYIEKFFKFVVKSEAYDARSRTVARRMCHALNLSALEFSDLETAHYRAAHAASDSSPNLASTAGTHKSTAPVAKRYFDAFNQDKHLVPASSLLASFRVWRVAFIAAGGGALMAVTGRIAAPAIMNTVLPLICASNTLGQVSMAISATLSCMGVTSYELIPGLMSAYGAAVAGKKMLRRTAPLGEFALEPLHVPIIVDMKRSGVKSAGNSSTDNITDASTSCGRIADDVGDDNNDDDEDMIVVENTAWSALSTTTTSSTSTLPAEKAPIGAPIYMLVSGHIDSGVDARQVWGANGIARSSHIGKATPEVTVDSSKVSEVNSHSGKDENEQTGTDLSTTGTAATEASPPAVAAVVAAAVVASVSDPQVRSASRTEHRCGGFAATARKIFDFESKAEFDADWEELAVPVNGWWREAVAPAGDDYILTWEPQMLSNLNESFQKLLVDEMVGRIKGMVKGELLQFTPIPAIQAAASLPMMVLGKINELDDPWVMAIDRARQAGKLLARVLMVEHRRHEHRVHCSKGQPTASTRSTSSSGRGTESCTGITSQIDENNADHNHDAFQDELASVVDAFSISLRQNSGNTSAAKEPKLVTNQQQPEQPQQTALPQRPITLVGYGMGARLIFHCLETLAAEGGTNARGIIENAVLIGTPVGTSAAKWTAVRSVVADRLVNCYATNDWLLALLYRCKSYDIGVAGLYPVQTDVAHTTGDTSAAAASVDTPAVTSSAPLPPSPPSTAATTSAATTTTTAPAASSAANYAIPATREGRSAAITATVGAAGDSSLVENIDVTDLISSHSDYPLVLPAIMKRVNLQ